MTHSEQFDIDMLRTAFYDAMNTVNSHSLSVMNVNDPKKNVVISHSYPGTKKNRSSL